MPRFPHPLGDARAQWVLPSLTKMNLGQNSVEGVLGDLCDMHAPLLLEADLSGNRFTGSVPPCLPATKPLLQRLLVPGNRVTGIVPPAFATYNSLIQLGVCWGAPPRACLPASGCRLLRACCALLPAVHMCAAVSCLFLTRIGRHHWSRAVA